MWWDQRHTLWLITKAEFRELPDGTTLTAIDGETVVKGIDQIELDTKAGKIAYGFTIETAPLKYKHHFFDKARKSTLP